MIGFVVNPAAGNGRGKRAWEKVRRELIKEKVEYQARITEKSGEARQLTQELLRQGHLEKIVAIGGDGTLNEVVNGLVDSGADCLLGHIPAGSGNDFARAYHLPMEPVAAWKCIEAGEGEKTIDLLMMNDRVAVNAIGAGFDGKIAKTANEASYKKMCNQVGLGKLAYIISMLRVLFSYRPCDLTLTIEDELHECKQAWMIVVSNIANYGGGMQICPHAVSDDGRAEVCVISNISRWQLLRAFPKIFTGEHTSHPAVRFYHGRSIRVESEDSLDVHADGEAIAKTPVTVALLANRLRIIANR
ncbi:diacylglycerol/lipid kinase family protein [Brevibacillus migulae]|uniref:diacylglycerol/lipid kinase family protein n=1 Tax=Brevibacillus migulae TaxID=1644114 RepID=UPI00106ED48A|nr:diacylglycerol kinase family protein [Brevibacillus migulae]